MADPPGPLGQDSRKQDDEGESVSARPEQGRSQSTGPVIKSTSASAERCGLLIDPHAKAVHSGRVRVGTQGETANADIVTLHAVTSLASRPVPGHSAFCLEPSVSIEYDHRHPGCDLLNEIGRNAIVGSDTTGNNSVKVFAVRPRLAPAVLARNSKDLCI